MLSDKSESSLPAWTDVLYEVVTMAGRWIRILYLGIVLTFPVAQMHDYPNISKRGRFIILPHSVTRAGMQSVEACFLYVPPIVLLSLTI